MREINKIKFLGDFINGQFSLPREIDNEWNVISPADHNDEVMNLTSSFEAIDAACEAARKAYRGWAHLSIERRKEYLLRLKEVYISHEKDMILAIARETGKPLWEAETEVKGMIGKITITLDHSLKLVAEQLIKDALPGVDGYIRFKPRGVMAVLGPFNFPGHLPNGHIIPALITGNTVVFKPSEKTPVIAQFMAQMFKEADFPPGVFNLIHGQGETGKRLSIHSEVDGVLFTGSYDVGVKIKEATLHHHWKLLALEMGGKNCSIVWDDADLEKAVYENIIGAFVTAGQRCSCTSKIIVHQKVKDKFIENFHAAAKRLTINHWSENPFMGPLINGDSVDKYVRFQEIGSREGAESLMRGKVLDLDHEGHYVTPSINLVEKFDPESIYQKTEIFGPNVGIYTVNDFEEALEINNSSGFGLVMSVFSEDRKYYEKSLIDARVGLVNWNRTTNGASSRLPFGGMGKSGNDRPSAHFAVNYCTIPVGSLEDTTKFDKTKVFPGMNYEYKG